MQADRFGRFGRGVFQRFGEQPAEHAGGVQGQRQGTGIRAEAGGQDHQRSPYQFRNRAQGVEHQARRALERPAESTGCRQRQ
ncbi:hypothetical protein D3C76_1140840 [compost metagenome]